MMTCEQVQDQIAEHGLAVLERDPALRVHVDNCPRCSAFVRQFGQLEDAIVQLPQHPAPEGVLARAEAAVAHARREQGPKPPVRARRWAVALASVATLLALIGISPLLNQLAPPLARVARAPQATFADRPTFSADAEGKEQAQLRLDGLTTASEAGADSAAVIAQNEPVPMQLGAAIEEAESAKDVGHNDNDAQPERQLANAAPAAAPPAPARRAEAKLRAKATEEEAKQERAAAEWRAPETDALQSQLADERERRENTTKRDRSSVAAGNRANQDSRDFKPAAPLPVSPEPVSSVAPPSLPSEPTVIGGAGGKASTMTSPLAAAQRFLNQREILEGLNFQPATGYWANTYLPGDPALRQLAVRLRGWNRSPLRAVTGSELLLEQAATPYRQPFDAPQDAALALYLQADKAALEGPSRLRVQIGIRGAERQSSRRPALNLAVLADLRSPERASLAPALRAVLAALLDAKQPDDRFSLTVAGAGGGVVLTPEHFRHGPITIALQTLFERPSDGAVTSLAQALELAGQTTRESAAPEAALGASLVLLLAAAPIGDELPHLMRSVHTHALAGINVSVVELSAQAEAHALHQLALTGQGRLWSLSDPAAAAPLIEQELYAVSRAVARALRLRIRLAPSVKLIDVLGSRRLDETQAQRVREQEQSIDQRLARSLGIQADRGEDEEGIQIVIPQFLAGDAHVVLLDVVAAGPGPVADVTLRYKDLAYLRNGVASAHLTLPAGTTSAGPLARNVLKNQLALSLAQAATQASERLSAGAPDAAAQLLAAQQELWQGLRAVLSGWAADAELLRDERLLAEYQRVLASTTAADPSQREPLIASLRLAAHRKLLNLEDGL